eukprot:2274022-Rhodomonas_salina.5
MLALPSRASSEHTARNALRIAAFGVSPSSADRARRRQDAGCDGGCGVMMIERGGKGGGDDRAGVRGGNDEEDEEEEREDGGGDDGDGVSSDLDERA